MKKTVIYWGDTRETDIFQLRSTKSAVGEERIRGLLLDLRCQFIYSAAIEEWDLQHRWFLYESFVRELVNVMKVVAFMQDSQ